MKDNKGKNVLAIMDEIMPEGYVRWQPIPGRNVFKVNLATETAINDALTEMEASDNPIFNSQELINSLSGAFRNMAVLGGRKKTYILPDDIVKTLNEIGKPKVKENLLGSAMRNLTTIWKVDILLNPFRIIKYNLNNTSGDADMAIASDPRIIKNVKRSVRDLLKMKRGVTNKTIETALRDGVISSGRTMAYLSD